MAETPILSSTYKTFWFTGYTSDVSGKNSEIEKDKEGRPEIHYSRIYSAFRRFEAHGCFDAIFTGSVSLLHQKGDLDLSVIHGDGTTTAAKKVVTISDERGHKHFKGDKVVAN